MTIPKVAIEAALNAKTDELPEGVQYVLVRGLHAMGWELPASGSWEVMEAAILAALPHLGEPIGVMTIGSIDRLRAGLANHEPVVNSEAWRIAQSRDDYSATVPVFLAPPAPALPEGWKLVPVNAYPEMLGAWYRYKSGFHFPDEPEPTDTSDMGAYRAMLAAAPEPPASVSESPDNLNSQGSLDGSEPMMTDAEFDQLVEDVGQPEDVFPYLLVPVPTADPVNAQDDSPAAVLYETMENLHAHGVIDDKTMKRFQPADPIRAQLVEALEDMVDYYSCDATSEFGDEAGRISRARAALVAAEEGNKHK